MHFSASKNVNSRALLSLWLNHLALCATRQLSRNEISQLIIPGSGGVRFGYLEEASAKTLLANYIRLFQQGLRYPLPVFPNTSYTWASQADPEVAMSKALGIWYGGNYRNAVRGEREDEFIRLALHNNTANPVADAAIPAIRTRNLLPRQSNTVVMVPKADKKVSKVTNLDAGTVLELDLDGIKLIEASAGTGKTHTIADLYLRHILAGRQTSQILIVTYTNAATEELRGRIRKRLYDALNLFEQADAVKDELFPLLLQQWQDLDATTRKLQLGRLQARFTQHGRGIHIHDSQFLSTQPAGKRLYPVTSFSTVICWPTMISSGKSRD